jgi:hypothetical protein
MQPSNWSRNRVNLSIRSLSCTRHRAESFFQSVAVGARFSGNVASASRISASGIPVLCATLITATLRSTSRAYRRWFPLFRQLLIKPCAS